MRYLKKLAAVVIFVAALVVISLPAIGGMYLAAWGIDFLIAINFDSAWTHGSCVLLGVFLTLVSINTDELLNTLNPG
ncbi:hypothetical protein PSI9734_01329 [Pseudidiomarina piscicola]|uniref:Uncharacterized protein n=1 Tax=Pseudidiomarina piscicola TaxID=2614830 RepID=A0A6S6WPL9_9GAMM|nr:hypothetical protein [Pseudidiomarina piscicola]CAB0150890.1 hypothetical protein PSI9734_01329 [Pseudidiomarina piscicola]VZT40395.1 hypothetical protein PSI9734_01329 [Pseudomonas aeruginosa]